MTDFLNEGERINKENDERILQGQNELRELLSLKIGRKFVFKILEDGYIFTSTFTQSSKDYFNAGKREIALSWFNNILDLDPNIFAKMCKEFRGKND